MKYYYWPFIVILFVTACVRGPDKCVNSEHVDIGCANSAQ
jgi:hypothetical protein